MRTSFPIFVLTKQGNPWLMVAVQNTLTSGPTVTPVGTAKEARHEKRDQMTSVEPISEVARSADGSSIGFLRLGSGPALLFVHGSLSSGESWLPVATAMAGRFTCYVMDRRGRGRSGDTADYSLQRECEISRRCFKSLGRVRTY